jgi:hypothetical protein
MGELLGDRLVADIERLRVEGPAFVFDVDDAELLGEDLAEEGASIDPEDMWAPPSRPDSPSYLKTSVDELAYGLGVSHNESGLGLGGSGLVGYYNTHINSHHLSSLENEVALQSALKRLNEHLAATEIEEVNKKYQAVAAKRRLE